MKFPYSMLLDFVQTALNAEQVGDLLTMAGFELEGIEEVDGEPVLDIKVMSNRGDGLSVFGLSREVLAKDRDAEPTDLYRRAASRFADEDPHPNAPTPRRSNAASVTIETPDCNRYACVTIENAANGEAPALVRQRLQQAGMRSISLLVDLTNYVMLEVGQPLHAFDYEKLVDGRIVVRKARAGERLTTLNGVEHELREDQMMICDAERPVAAAGVMGGLETEVDENTTRVLLESAHFLNTSVRRTRKQMGLNTEASYRFERSVDPEGVVAALHRFVELLREAIPQCVVSEVVDVYPGRQERQPVAVRVDRARKLLGVDIRDEEAQQHLERLGMEVAGHGDPFFVIPPTWRPDIVREEDLVEELGRVHGYEKIPEQLPQGTTTMGGPQGFYLQVDRLREAMTRLGFVQIVSHSLRDTSPLDDPNVQAIGPRHPASPEMSVLRTSLLPGLADALRRNGSRNLHLFEMGQVFGGPAENPVERKRLAVVSTGALLPQDRKGVAVDEADFFSLKGTLADAGAALGVSVTLAVPESVDARLHPTRQATVRVGPSEVGTLGQIHPNIAAELGLDPKTFLSEIDVERFLQETNDSVELRPISRNPAVRRDISLEIDKSVPWQEIEAAVVGASGDVLERHWLFDVFEGGNIPAGKHSLGIALQLRKLGATFTDEEANQVRERAVAALVALGGTTR
jgi:phenylalanyl-tRNA synthetase beta chain